MTKHERINELVVTFFWEIYNRQPVMTIREAREIIAELVEAIDHLDDMSPPDLSYHDYDRVLKKGKKVF